MRLVLDRGAVASRELDDLIEEDQVSLATLLTNLITIGQVTTAHINGIEQLMVTYPDVVAGGYTVVPGDGTAHFGLVLNADDPKACTAGYGGTTRIGPDQTKNLPPLNSSARCTLPRGSPSSVRGAQNAPTPAEGAGSSYPLGMSGTPVPLGNPAATRDGLNPAPLISIPSAPVGATGTDQWIWLMTGAAR